MEFDKIILELSKNNMVDVGQGEIFIKKQIREYIGGVAIYDILVDFVDQDNKRIEETRKFTDIEDLREFSVINEQGISMHRCTECGSLPEKDYYLDLENNNEFCSYACLVKFMNKVYGIGNWKICDDGINEIRFYVKIEERDIPRFDSIKRDSDGWWRQYRMKHINNQYR